MSCPRLILIIDSWLIFTRACRHDKFIYLPECAQHVLGGMPDASARALLTLDVLDAALIERFAAFTPQYHVGVFEYLVGCGGRAFDVVKAIESGPAVAVRLRPSKRICQVLISPMPLLVRGSYLN